MQLLVVRQPHQQLGQAQYIHLLCISRDDTTHDQDDDEQNYDDEHDADAAADSAHVLDEAVGVAARCVPDISYCGKSLALSSFICLLMLILI